MFRSGWTGVPAGPGTTARAERPWGIRPLWQCPRPCYPPSFLLRSSGPRRLAVGGPPAGEGQQPGGSQVSRSINRITLVGNVGRDPEVRVTGSGAKVANI
ncbi:MAG: single-stranded DNA-binding protein, partial [Gemmatimonadetes bacterium]|nr:single-stranded DNA-binding protein [Gemmatimonadota bacterium]